MSTSHQSRSRVFGLATMVAFTLLAPGAVSAQEVADTTQQEVAVLAPVAAPAVVSTSAASVRAVAQALAAQDALLSGEMGSLQEERLRAIVAAAPAAGPSWDETSGYGAVEASRATIDDPAGSITAAQTRVLAAQRALQGGDLGSLQEEALLAVVSAASTTQVPADVRWAPADMIGPESASAVSPDYLPVALGTGTRSESVHLATVALPLPR